MYKTASIIIFICMFVFSCKNSTEQKVRNKAFIVLFDISLSIDKLDVTASFLDNFKTVFQAIDGGDAIIAGLISDKSLSENKLPVNYTLPVYDKKTDNPMYEKADKEAYDKDLVKIKDSLYACTSNLLGKKEQTGSTDIFGALQLAQKVFSNYNDFDKTLVVMSDMVQSDRVYDFETYIPDAKRTKQILEELKSKKQIAALNGVKVYVCGANTSDTDSYNKLQHFWTEYFREAGADFTADRFCATLIKFDE